MALGGLTACGDKLEITPPATTTPGDQGVKSVAIVPQQATLGVGQKQQFTATVVGGSDVTDFGVTWSSTDATVASVDGNGMVTANKAGTANIIATSKANTNFRAVAPVVVNPDQPFSVNFTGLFQGANAATIDSIAGQITAKFSVQQGTGAQRIDSVQVVMTCGTTQTVVYTQRYTSGTPGGQVEATWNTAAFNATTGAPLYPNANGCTVLARGFAGGSNVASVATPSTAINLKNLDVVRIVASASGSQASNAAGNLWNSGDVVVKVLPTLYSGTTIASTNVTLTGTDADTAALSTYTKTLTGGAGTATFPLPGVTFPDAAIAATFIGAQGQSIPFTPGISGGVAFGQQYSYPNEIAGAGFMRVDNESPDAATNLLAITTTNNWIGGNFTFTTAGLTPTVTGLTGAGGAIDEGVNTNTITFYAIPQASFTGLGTAGALGDASGAACVPTGTLVSNSSTLAGTPATTPNGYVLRAFITDRLGNVRCQDIPASGAQTSFGVDPVRPIASFTSTSNIASNGAITTAGGGTQAIRVTTTDSLSGFVSPATRLQTVAIRNDSVTAATCIIGNFAAATGCTPVATDTAITAASLVGALAGTGTQVGYFKVTTYAQDVAGNTSTPVLTRTVIYDLESPAVSSVAQAAAVAPMATVTANVAATDNFDLGTGSTRLEYLTATAVRFQGSSATLGSFGLPSETTGSYSSTVAPALRSVSELSAITAGTAGAAVQGQIVGRVTDQAGNLGTLNSANLAFVTGTAAAATPTIISASVTTTSGGVPAATIANGTQATYQLRVRVTGAQIDQPFGRVGIYSYSTSTGVMTQVGSDITASSVSFASDGSGDRIYTYTLPAVTATTSTTSPTNNWRVLAVAPDGNAIVSPTVTVTSTF